MEKEMLAIAKLKSGEGKFEKFMGFMQSDEGMAVRKTIAHVEKTVPAIAPDKSYVMFKVLVHNEEEMKKFASGNNPIAKPIFDECGEVVQMYELSLLEPVWIWQAFFLKKRFIKQLTIVSVRFITKNCDNCFTRTKFFS